MLVDIMYSLSFALNIWKWNQNKKLDQIFLAKHLGQSSSEQLPYGRAYIELVKIFFSTTLTVRRLLYSVRAFLAIGTVVSVLARHVLNMISIAVSRTI